MEALMGGGSDEHAISIQLFNGQQARNKENDID
jgi:hypothetical protein